MATKDIFDSIFQRVANPQQTPMEPVPSPQQGFQEYQGLASPVVSEALRQNRQTLSDALRMRSISPEQVNEMINSGSLLRGAQGVTNSKDLFGLTGADMDAVINRRVSPYKVLGDTMSFADNLTGAPEARKSLQHAADQELATTLSTTQAGLTEGFKNRDSALARNAARANHNTSEVNAGAGRAANLLQGQEQLDIAQARLRLDREKAAYEKVYYKNLSDAMKQGATSMPADPNMYKLWDTVNQDQAPSYFDPKTKALNVAKLQKDLASFDPRKPEFNELRNFVHTDMLKRSVGQPFMSKFPLSGYSKVLGGWTDAVLQPDGWYGLTKDAKGIITGQSPRPIVPFGATSSKASTGGSRGSAYKYPDLSAE